MAAECNFFYRNHSIDTNCNKLSFSIVILTNLITFEDSDYIFTFKSAIHNLAFTRGRSKMVNFESDFFSFLQETIVLGVLHPPLKPITQNDN